MCIFKCFFFLLFLLNSSAVKNVDYSEVLYPGEFSDVYPNGILPPLPSCWEPGRWLSLPITHLSHITHNKEASLIRMDAFCYTFQSRQKIGKDLERDGSPIGETFRKIGEDRYTRIPKPQPVFPGYISWWGMSFKNWYREPGENFQTVIKRIRSYLGERSVFEVNYLANPPASRYGNREFIFSFHDLIDSYKQSRTDCQIKDVYLRKAGTLRYRYEVCYMVMVVMLKDLNNDAIRDMPSMYNEPRFGHNGCINADGKLVKDGPLSFNIKRPFSWIKDQQGSVSWESMVFAFYFEKHDQFLSCVKPTGKEDNVHHDIDRCTSKQPPEPLTCPNIPRTF